MRLIIKSRFFIATVMATQLAVTSPAFAQEVNWPSRPIRLIVGFPPGGGADAVARIYGHKLGELLKQSIVIENKPGAGTTIAAEQAAASPGDGYTLYMGGPVLFGVDKVLYPKIRYDSKSFVPITKLTSSPLILATRNDAPYKSAQELVDFARKNPGKIFYTSSGNGGSPHMAAAMFMEQFGVDMAHVPYKGGAQSVQAVVAKDADITFATPPTVLPLVKAGRLSAIAITTKEKSSGLPNLGTIAQQTGSAYDLSFWFGLFAPKGTPDEVVKKIFDASQTAMNTPEVKTQLSTQGSDVALSESPQQFTQWVMSQAQSHAQLAKRAGVKVD